MGLGWHKAAIKTVEVQNRSMAGLDTAHHGESGWAAPTGTRLLHTIRVQEEKGYESRGNAQVFDLRKRSIKNASLRPGIGHLSRDTCSGMRARVYTHAHTVTELPPRH